MQICVLLSYQTCNLQLTFMMFLNIGNLIFDLQFDLAAISAFQASFHLLSWPWLGDHNVPYVSHCGILAFVLVLTIFMYLILLIQLHAGFNFKVGQLMSNFQSSHYIWTLLALALYKYFTSGLWRPYVFVF